MYCQYFHSQCELKLGVKNSNSQKDKIYDKKKEMWDLLPTHMEGFAFKCKTDNTLGVGFVDLMSMGGRVNRYRNWEQGPPLASVKFH